MTFHMSGDTWPAAFYFRAVLLNIPLTLIYGMILFLLGTVMYAYYANETCDPLEAGIVSNGNQVAPYFVMHILAKLPGLAGLFLAALFSGALSSLSSGINSMGANTVQDILVSCLRNKTQWTKTLTAKLLVFLYGALAVTLAYLAKDLTGPVTQISLGASGAFGGPVAGLIFLGGLFPQANWMGAFTGGVVGLVINVWVSVGSVLYGKRTPFSPSIGVDGCSRNQTDKFDNFINTTLAFESTTSSLYQNITESSHSKKLDTAHLPLYDVTYLYFGLIGFIVTIVVGIIVSIITDCNQRYTSEPVYIFPCVRSICKYMYKVRKDVSEYKVDGKANTKSRNKHRSTEANDVDLTSYNKLPDKGDSQKY